MICVLRIGGVEMNTATVRQAFGLEPYRTDVCGTDDATTNCLYYDVSKAEEASPEECISRINEFLSVHGAELASMISLEGIEFRNLDVGLMLYEDRASASFELSEKLVHRLSELHLSVSISTYPAILGS